MTVPSIPTAQTSFEELPQTAVSVRLVPLSGRDHAVPFQWTTLPPSPTSQVSFRPFLHMALSHPPWGVGFDQHHPLEEHAPTPSFGL
jgi:hypothetical protein